MLVLRIEKGQRIRIGDDIEIALPEDQRIAVLAIQAPKSVPIIRIDVDGNRLTGPRKRKQSPRWVADWQKACAGMEGDELKRDEFEAKWAEWVQHRREIRRTLTPLTVKKQVRQLEKLGLPQALLSIDLSISNGWMGLFTPNKEIVAQKAPKTHWADDLRADGIDV